MCSIPACCSLAHTMRSKGHPPSLELNVSIVTPSVCGADESPPGRAGRAGRHRLQVGADRGEEEVLLPGGPAVLRHQAAHQLPLQGDRIVFHCVYVALFWNCSDFLFTTDTFSHSQMFYIGIFKHKWLNFRNKVGINISLRRASFPSLSSSLTKRLKS